MAERKRQANIGGGRRVIRQLKLSVAQDTALRVHADELGVSVQRLLVESTLSAFQGETVTERRDLLTALFQLQRGLAAAGNNINQIARVANSTGEIKNELHGSLEHLRATVNRIDEVLESLKIVGEPS
ncbi:plasmid mobilization relaxosome protein MobC [Glutamicibacter arilaitensis]|uniref:plasmid mobilization relaxosome protein MobC n=1 Tax=Glutamicibacter arilaitensis TaxID=256701 RepID=UPI003FD1D1DF